MSTLVPFDHLEPGMRVRVTQQMLFGTSARAASVEGEVVRVGQQKTGSWFAHSKDGKLWLDRLLLRKDDGELATVNLDARSSVQVLSAAQPKRP